MFTPVLAKHSKNFSLQDSLAIGVDRMQRNFEPMRHQAELWQVQQISTATAKLIIYRAFIEGDLAAPKHLAGVVHDLYFKPKYEEFQPRTMWSLSNAFRFSAGSRFSLSTRMPVSSLCTTCPAPPAGSTHPAPA